MLVEIKTVECPHCKNNKVVAESRDHKHCNGHWNETREFDCGYTIKFTPNYMREEETQDCPKSRKAKIKRTQQAAVYNAIAEVVGKQGLTERCVKAILNDVEFKIRYNWED